MSYEDFVAGITDRGMERFAANGPHIILDTTDFDQVDKGKLIEQILLVLDKKA